MRTDPGTADRPIPDALANRLQTAFALDEPPATFADWAAAMIDTYETELDRDLGPDDLCLVDASNHEARIGGETYRYQCVLDALVVGYLTDGPVTVRSVPPTAETPITVEFDDAVRIEPRGAVMSFGIDADVEAPDYPITPASMYGNLCPYGHAFPTEEAYADWAASSDAVSTAVPLRDGLAIARDLLDLADLDGDASI